MLWIRGIKWERLTGLWDLLSLMQQKGEFVGSNTTVLGLTRQVEDREQRIFIAGDADWMSNRELVQGRQGFPGA